MGGPAIDSWISGGLVNRSFRLEPEDQNKENNPVTISNSRTWRVNMQLRSRIRRLEEQEKKRQKEAKRDNRGL